MFEQFLRQGHSLACHRQGPHSEERQRYIAHLVEEGRSLNRLKQIVGLLLAIARRVSLDQGAVTMAQIESAAEHWLQTRPRTYGSAKGRHTSKTAFVFQATSWLRFLGRLHQPEVRQHCASNLDAFLQFLKDERGLAPVTISIRRFCLSRFLNWAGDQSKTLKELTAEDISHYFCSATVHRWKRTTISVHVNSLRHFFRFAESQHWCETGLAATIDAPRLYTHEGLPRGPQWSDVQRLISASRGDSPTDIRDHAILLLFAVYAFRNSEVRLLRLEDIDWEQDTIRVFRSKQRKTQHYPLVPEVGAAILRYLREGRPETRRREIFLCMKQPYQALTASGLGSMVRSRQHALGLSLSLYGPHALRHACASRLLAEGFSLKEIGDHLGHVSSVATQVYAKVDVSALREVAQMDLRGLVEYTEASAGAATPVFARGDIAALRAVAALSLGGLL
jgi:integrase/recombinase XerD